MSKNHSIAIEEKIHSALNACIGKMADRLLSTFNPQDKASLALFRQFCSALKTRLQWIKDTAKTLQEVTGIVQRSKDTVRNESTQSNTGPTWTERMLNRINPNNPLQPKDLNNGLVITRKNL